MTCLKWTQKKISILILVKYMAYDVGPPECTSLPAQCQRRPAHIDCMIAAGAEEFLNWTQISPKFK